MKITHNYFYTNINVLVGADILYDIHSKANPSKHDLLKLTNAVPILQHMGKSDTEWHTSTGSWLLFFNRIHPCFIAGILTIELIVKTNNSLANGFVLLVCKLFIKFKLCWLHK